MLVGVWQVGIFGIVCSALDSTVSTLLRHGLLEDRKSWRATSFSYVSLQPDLQRFFRLSYADFSNVDDILGT